jgi:hypothetical protein
MVMECNHGFFQVASWILQTDLLPPSPVLMLLLLPQLLAVPMAKGSLPKISNLISLREVRPIHP